MKKFLLTLVVLFVLVIGGAGAYLYVNGTALMKDAITQYGPQATGTAVSVGGVSLLPFNGKAGVSDMSVGSPPGYSAPYTFKVDNIDIALQPKTLLDDVLMIDTITISAPSVVFEPKGRSSNLQEIQKNIEAYNANSGESSFQGPEKIIVKQLRITQPEVRVFGGGLIGEQSITASDVLINDIGVAEGGVAPDAIATIVMDEMQKDVMSALKSKAGKAILNEVLSGGVIDDILPTDKVKDVLKGDVGQGVKDLLGGFGKKKE